MKKTTTTFGAVAAATALVLAMSVPAFALVPDTTGNGDYQGTLNPNGSFDATATITAEVTAPDAKVISVTVPSTLALPVATMSSSGGNVLDAANTPAQTVQVKNNAASSVPVRVVVSDVAETADATNGEFLSAMVNVTLAGEDAVVLSKDTTYTTNNVLASSLAAGSSASLQLVASEKTSTTVVKDGSYTLKTTLKVSAL